MQEISTTAFGILYMLLSFALSYALLWGVEVVARRLNRRIRSKNLQKKPSLPQIQCQNPPKPPTKCENPSKTVEISLGECHLTVMLQEISEEFRGKLMQLERMIERERIREIRLNTPLPAPVRLKALEVRSPGPKKLRKLRRKWTRQYL